MSIRINWAVYKPQIFTIIAILLFLFTTTSKTHAATITDIKPGVSVSLKIQDTDLSIAGCVAPNSLVTISRDGTIVSASASNASGIYNSLLTAQSPGLHTINTVFEDIQNNRSSVTSDLIALPSKTLTSATINPPPTVIVDAVVKVSGQPITFQGYACPVTTVRLLIDNNLSVTTTSDANGYWSTKINTVNFSEGLHSYVVSAYKDSYASNISQKYSFTINKSDNIQPSINSSNELFRPTITAPSDGFVSSTRQVELFGIGPKNTQIDIFIDDLKIGSVFSNSNGEWSLTLTSLRESQIIKARSCNSTKCSDFSNQIVIKSTGPPLICNINIRLENYRFNNIKVNNGIDIQLNVAVPSSENKLTIDWGDVTIDHSNFVGQNRSIHHTYDQIGNYNGTIKIEKQSGCYDIVYFSVEVVGSKPINGRILFWPVILIPLYIFRAQILYIISKIFAIRSRPK